MASTGRSGGEVGRALLAVPSPRDYGAAVRAIRAIDYVDQFWVRFVPEMAALATIRKFFLDRREYDTLILCPDDLLPAYYAVAQLLRDLGRHPEADVVTGCANVRREGPHSDLLNVSQHRLGDRPDALVTKVEEYKFLPIATVYQRSERVIPTWFVGFSLTAFRRPAVERVPFRYSALGPCQTDLAWCLDADAAGLARLADLDVFVPHHPLYSGAPELQLQVGLREPEVEFHAASAPPPWPVQSAPART